MWRELFYISWMIVALVAFLMHTYYVRSELKEQSEKMDLILRVLDSRPCP